MSKGIFITATDTDMGKTFVSALILKALKARGINATYFKGALSGAREEEGTLIPEDAEFVCKISEINPDYDSMVSYTLKHPYSPHLAARKEGVKISLEKIKSDYYKLKEKYDFVLVEGSGGIICPLNLDENKLMLEDVVKELKLESIIVCQSGLGAINGAVITYRYLESIGVKTKAIIMNRFDKNNIIHKDNKKVIKELTKLNSIYTLEENCNEISDINNLIKELLK